MSGQAHGARRGSLAAVLLAGALAMTGCGEFNGVYNMPLPGGADLGENPYTVKAEFRNVMDLVPQASVKVNKVDVGKVSAITLSRKTWTAEVSLQLNRDVKLPANATAQLKQTSLLGEKYVELAAPPNSGKLGPLAEGAVIPLERTNRNVEAEEVLGALSLLLNAGGVQQLQDISRELNKVNEGNEPELRSLLSNVRNFAGYLDTHKGEITKALDGMNRLSAVLRDHKDQIGYVLENIGPGLEVLHQQRPQLVGMLQALNNLSGVAVDTINKTKDDLIHDFKVLEPTLRKLAEAGKDLPNSLQLLATMPFTDAGVKTIKGDFANSFLTIDVTTFLAALTSPGQPQRPIAPPGPAGQPGGSSTSAPPLPLTPTIPPSSSGTPPSSSTGKPTSPGGPTSGTTGPTGGPTGGTSTPGGSTGPAATTGGSSSSGSTTTGGS